MAQLEPVSLSTEDLKRRKLRAFSGRVSAPTTGSNLGFRALQSQPDPSKLQKLMMILRGATQPYGADTGTAQLGSY